MSNDDDTYILDVSHVTDVNSLESIKTQLTSAILDQFGAETVEDMYEYIMLLINGKYSKKHIENELVSFLDDPVQVKQFTQQLFNIYTPYFKKIVQEPSVDEPSDFSKHCLNSSSLLFLIQFKMF